MDNEKTMTQTFKIPLEAPKIIKAKRRKSPVKKEVTNREAEGIYLALSEISNSEKVLPVETGFRIVENLRSMEKHIETYRGEIDRIIGRYAKDGKTVNREDDPEAFDECKKKLEELGNITISVDINELTMEQVSGLSLPMKHMSALRFMVAQEEGEDGTTEAIPTD